MRWCHCLALAHAAFVCAAPAAEHVFETLGRNRFGSCLLALPPARAVALPGFARPPAKSAAHQLGHQRTVTEDPVFAAPAARRPVRPCPVFPWAQSRRKWLWVVLPSRKADWFGCSHPLKASNDVCRVWRRRGSQGRPGLRGRGGMIAPGGRPGAMGDCP